MTGDKVTAPCHTCVFHIGSWQSCCCYICSQAHHHERCTLDQGSELHCCFYRAK